MRRGGASATSAAAPWQRALQRLRQRLWPWHELLHDSDACAAAVLLLPVVLWHRHRGTVTVAELFPKFITSGPPLSAPCLARLSRYCSLAPLILVAARAPFLIPVLCAAAMPATGACTASGRHHHGVTLSQAPWSTQTVEADGCLHSRSLLSVVDHQKLKLGGGKPKMGGNCLPLQFLNEVLEFRRSPKLHARQAGKGPAPRMHESKANKP